mmetsp:Transcript_100701/g.291054  ORF Transcript_100701/g.291054 Transcript_100701/m.291054 type:complete len:233 (+) Transcript_100701:209-907(+)
MDMGSPITAVILHSASRCGTGEGAVCRVCVKGLHRLPSLPGSRCGASKATAAASETRSFLDPVCRSHNITRAPLLHRPLLLKSRCESAPDYCFCRRFRFASSLLAPDLELEDSDIRSARARCPRPSTATNSTTRPSLPMRRKRPDSKANSPPHRSTGPPTPRCKSCSSEPSPKVATPLTMRMWQTHSWSLRLLTAGTQTPSKAVPLYRSTAGAGGALPPTDEADEAVVLLDA